MLGALGGRLLWSSMCSPASRAASALILSVFFHLKVHNFVKGLEGKNHTFVKLIPLDLAHSHPDKIDKTLNKLISKKCQLHD